MEKASYYYERSSLLSKKHYFMGRTSYNEKRLIKNNVLEFAFTFITDVANIFGSVIVVL